MVVSIGWWTKSLHRKWLFYNFHPFWIWLLRVPGMKRKPSLCLPPVFKLARWGNLMEISHWYWGGNPCFNDRFPLGLPVSSYHSLVGPNGFFMKLYCLTHLAAFLFTHLNFQQKDHRGWRPQCHRIELESLFVMNPWMLLNFFGATQQTKRQHAFHPSANDQHANLTYSLQVLDCRQLNCMVANHPNESKHMWWSWWSLGSWMGGSYTDTYSF